MNPFQDLLRTWSLPCLAVLVIAALAGSANAQITSAQQSAMKQSCRSDFMAKCSGVTPGGKEALACLQKNVASLSPACQQAVNSIMPAPPTASPKAVAATAAPTAPQPTAAQQSAMKQSCRNDFMSKCSGVSPGGKDALACLQKNVAGLSPACKQVVSTTIPAAAKTAPAAAAVAAPAAGPTPQQLKAVKNTCGRDFKLHCKGVQPGGPEALACLQSHAARLTPGCQTSLADIGDAVPVATTAAAVPATAAAAAPARPMPPGITPVGRIMRRVIRHNQ